MPPTLSTTKIEMPKLRNIKVSSDKLYLDPNNPRLFVNEREKISLDEIRQPGVQSKTQAKLSDAGGTDKFKIKNLVESIRKNTYVPELGGYIFVRKIPDSSGYLVLEGNRRVVAMRLLLEEVGQLEQAVRDSITTLEAQELQKDGLSEETFQEQISYILSTFHQGSQKKWKPYAQARYIYGMYKALAKQNKETFKFDQEAAASTASVCSISASEVKEKIFVYRVMEQLADQPEMKDKKNGGIIHSYYSIIEAGVSKQADVIKEYIPVHPDTCLLEEIAIDRMINLCNFDGTRERYLTDESGELLLDDEENEIRPAMKNIPQWRFFRKILEDEDRAVRDINLGKIERDHHHPEEIWAHRWSELTRFTWKRWLEQIRLLIEPVRFADPVLAEPNTLNILEKLGRVIGKLPRDT